MDPVPTLKIQIASKEEWLQWYRVFLYSSADLSLRDIAGVCAGSGRHISDEAVRQRGGPVRSGWKCSWASGCLQASCPRAPRAAGRVSSVRARRSVARARRAQIIAGTSLTIQGHTRPVSCT
jgi:hypothetical protein